MNIFPLREFARFDLAQADRFAIAFEQDEQALEHVMEGCRPEHLGIPFRDAGHTLGTIHGTPNATGLDDPAGGPVDSAGKQSHRLTGRTSRKLDATAPSRSRLGLGFCIYGDLLGRSPSRQNVVCSAPES